MRENKHSDTIERERNWNRSPDKEMRDKGDRGQKTTRRSSWCCLHEDTVKSRLLPLLHREIFYCKSNTREGKSQCLTSGCSSSGTVGKISEVRQILQRRAVGGKTFQDRPGIMDVIQLHTSQIQSQPTVTGRPCGQADHLCTTKTELASLCIQPKANHPPFRVLLWHSSSLWGRGEFCLGREQGASMAEGRREQAPAVSPGIG